MAEAEESFFNSGCLKNPVFAYRNGRISSAIKEYSNVDFDLFQVAKRIIDSAPNPERIGADYLKGTDLLDMMREYVADLGVSKQVVFQEVSGMLSIATVLKPGSESPADARKPVVSVNPDAKLSPALAKGIISHEIGTHLLRMINEDHQVWAGAGRRAYKLQNHFATEEGLATLNTLFGSGETFLWNSALNYASVCKASKSSFIEVYNFLEPYLPDARKRFKLCARVKRGFMDTSQPGACNLDQNYFSGAVEILRNLKVVDIRLLYAGQIAYADLGRLKNLIRTSCIKLPPFLSSPEKYQDYVERLSRIAEANMLI